MPILKSMSKHKIHVSFKEDKKKQKQKLTLNMCDSNKMIPKPVDFILFAVFDFSVSLSQSKLKYK